MRVLAQSFVSDFSEAKASLEHSKWMFHLSTQLGLSTYLGFLFSTQWMLVVGSGMSQVFGMWSSAFDVLLLSVVGCITPYLSFLSVQQRVFLLNLSKPAEEENVGCCMM